MADYLSRHPTELQGASVKAETLWNKWFTLNSVISLNNDLDIIGARSEQGESVKCAAEKHTVNRINLASERKPVRMRDACNSRESIKKHCSYNTRKMSESPSIRLINEKLLAANYAADKTIQRVTTSVKNHNKTGTSRLNSPWREKFQSFTANDKVFLFVDKRLVISISLRPMMMCSLNYGHPGRDSMLSMITDIWWLRIHWEVVDQVRLCDEFFQSGKNLKCMQRQNQVGKLAEASEQYEEIALDFAGPFPNAKKRKEIPTSIDRPVLWMARGKLFTHPNNEKVPRIFKTIDSSIRGTAEIKI